MFLTPSPQTYADLVFRTPAVHVPFVFLGMPCALVSRHYARRMTIRESCTAVSSQAAPGRGVYDVLVGASSIGGGDQTRCKAIGYKFIFAASVSPPQVKLVRFPTLIEFVHQRPSE